MITQAKTIKQITLLCSVIYFISYLTRLNYGAVVVSISESTKISQTSLALAPTVSFITYGLGQLVSGYMGDKIQPKILVLAGLILTTLMNLLLPFSQSAILMAVFWGINGLAQAFMWPPIVKLMLSSMDEKEYKKQTKKILLACIFSTMAIYLMSPIIVKFLNWQSVFYICAIFGVLGIIYWVLCCPTIELVKKQKVYCKDSQIKEKKASFAPVLIYVLISIVCMGALRDGVTTWVPSYVAEAFNLGSETAILTGAVLPVFTIICYFFAAYLYEKKLTNPILCAGVIFLIGVFAAGLLWLLTFVGVSQVIISIILAALLTGSMHGVNLMLISMLPAYFKKQGNTSMISGILNCCVYVGSAISTYLFPLIASKGGWVATILIWFIISVVGTAILFMIVPKWKKYEDQIDK